MVEPISVPYRVSQTAGTESFFDIFTIPAGRKFKLMEVEVDFPSGTNGYLQLALYHGIRQIVPESGYWNLDQGRVVARCEYVFTSGEVVKLWAKNTHSTNTYAATIQLEGELF